LRRKCLLAVLEICHDVVMTRGIKDEWMEHASGFARTWLATMKGKKKYDSIPRTDRVPGLGEAIAAAPWSEKKKKKAAKDVHLIEAAVATDRAIISCDDKARKSFGELARAVPLLREIVWVNPWKAEEQCESWLAGGAPQEKDRTLGANRV
jgi:hypothetical protein